MGATRPPLDYLATCSEMALESIELSRLSQASNLRKELRQILEEWIESEVDARFARSILEWRRAQSSDAHAPPRKSESAGDIEQMAISFLPPSLDESREQAAADSLPAQPSQSALPVFEARKSCTASPGDAQLKMGRRGPADVGVLAQRSCRSTAKEIAEISDSATGLIGTVAACSAPLAKIAALALGELERLAQYHSKAVCGSLVSTAVQSSAGTQLKAANLQFSRNTVTRGIALLVAARKESPEGDGIEDQPLFRSAARIRSLAMDAAPAAQDPSLDAVETASDHERASVLDNLVQLSPEQHAPTLARLMHSGSDARSPFRRNAAYHRSLAPAS